MKPCMISLMCQTELFMKSTALITAISLAMLVTSPAAMALRTATDNVHAQAGDSNPEARLSALLEQITHKFDALEAAHEAGQATDTIVGELEQLQDQMIALDNEVMANFDAMEQKLKGKNLPGTILQRHQDMVAHYQAHRARIIEQFEDKDMSHWRWLLGHWWDRLLAWLGVDIEEIVDSPIQDVNPRQFKRSQQAFDPNNLPNKSMRPDKDNQPKQTKQDYHQASLFNSPAKKLAELGGFSYDALAGASDPAYLAETDEVILTQRIKDQAQALAYDPVKIYHWVRNNVEWQPTWGAVQDAELTLDARRGNAMDIAGLTIALLRASQIPARYVHGTIEVPEATFRNWAGGFTSIDAAADFAASGGIPTAAATAAGKIAYVQLEHVWVEAAIDYFPSRGASNRDADAWVQMDPSYKQYEYLQGLDAVAISGIDTNKLASDFLASGTINEAEGWIQGFDPTILENALIQAQANLEDYINTNMTDPSVRDVIGGRKTIIHEYPMLPSSLPNRILVEGARYDRLPSQLQQQVTYTLGVDELRRPYNPATFAWSTLNNEKVTLSFRPATPDDEAALLSLLPEEEISDSSQVPRSVPSYAIEVVPELKINGERVLTGLAMALGEELTLTTRISFPGRAEKEYYTYGVIAGSYLSLNVIAGSVSPEKIRELQENIKNVFDDIHKFRSTVFSRDEVLGNLLYSGTLGYFSKLLALNRYTTEMMRSSQNLVSGYGAIGVIPRVDYLFGFPVSIAPGNLTFDIPINVVSGSWTGDILEGRQAKFSFGIYSSILEQIVSEQIFGEVVAPIDAVSAVNAMNLALNSGQTLHHISSDNIDSSLNALKLGSDVREEIQQAIGARLEVFAHSDRLDFNGNSVAGYIIFDPRTGDAAYKISGGLNGALTAMRTIFHTFSMSQLYVSIAESAMGIRGATVYRSVVVGPLLAIANVVTTGVEAFQQCENKLIATAIVGITALMSFMLISAFSPAGLAAVGLANASSFILTGLLASLSTAVDLMMGTLIKLVC